MHIIVVGGGVVGVSTAWSLLEEGHTVELIEAREAVGLETSFANGGMLSTGMSEPWNAPGVWWDLIKSLFDSKSPMKLHPAALPSMSMWGLQFLANSSASKFWKNTEDSYRLCAFSVSETNRLVKDLALDCDYAERGELKIFQTEQAAEFSLELLRRLEPLGLSATYLDTDAVINMEPALAPIKADIACGLYYAQDSGGDAHKFTTALANKLVEQGGVIHLKTRVEKLNENSGRIVSVTCTAGGASRALKADATVVAAGNFTPALTKPFGIKLPIRPVKGYSLTIPAEGLTNRPTKAVINQAMRAAINPMGSRIRVAGTAEFTPSITDDIPKARIDNLFDLLRATYPVLAANVDRESAIPWAGYRPMSCDGKPFVGATSQRGLFVNSGHGYLGWTQAVGSARLIADAVENRAERFFESSFHVER